MYFFKRLAIRLGFILALALVIRGIGGLFSPAHPKNEVETVAIQTGSGGQILVPRQAFASSTLAASLDDPDMQAALAIVRARNGGTLGTGDGATMSFRSANGPVTLSASEVVVVNAEYRRFKAALDRVDTSDERD
jgi:hypothetical protein